MAVIPLIHEPPASTVAFAPEPLPSTSGTSTSRLRSLFHRRKSSNGSPHSSTRVDDEESRQLFWLPEPAHQSRSRSSLSSRVQAENADRSAVEVRPIVDRLPMRKKERVILDPPPLAQAYGQAILHAPLEAPVSFISKNRSYRGSSSPNHLCSTDSLEDSIEVKQSHRRTESRESVGSVKEKIFFLTNGPYIMQYDGDASGDALPEKILVLDKTSVAFASDVLPGRHWVLQISKRKESGGSTQKAQSLGRRPAWSRFTLRHAEDKRTVDTLLLVFKDSEELYSWLFAIRKEIEDLGGMEYRPDARNNDRTWKDDLTRAFTFQSDIETGSGQSMPALTQSSTAVSLAPNITTNTIPLSDDRPASSQSSTPSTKTSALMNGLRDSMASDSYTSTVATSSADGSIPATSPVDEEFPATSTATHRANGELALRAYPLRNSHPPRRNQSFVPAKSILERRKLSIGSLQLVNKENPMEWGRNSLADIPPTIMASPQTSVSPAIQLHGGVPTAQDGPPVRTLHGNSRPETDVQCNTTNDRPRRPSLPQTVSDSSKPKYSLFPVRSSTDGKVESLVIPPTRMACIPTSNKAKVGRVTIKENGTSEYQQQKARSRTLTLNARDQRVSAFLRPGDFDKPQRSPAATDEMIMMNFGAPCIEVPASPMPIGRVPGLNDLKFDMDFLRGAYKQEDNQNTSFVERRKIPGIKSMSNLLSETSFLVAKAPVGPPPAGPLPAIPTDSRRSSRTTNRSSQWSQSSQCSQQSKKMGRPILVEEKEGILVGRPRQKGSEALSTQERPNRHRHRRTISNSLDGPPPPERTSSKRNQARSRERCTSNNQI